MDKKQEAIAAERGKVYGDPQHSHKCIGLIFTALIQQHYGITLDHPVPDFLVAEMMNGMKLNRSVRVYHEDNYDDRAVYTDFAKGWLSSLTAPPKKKVRRGRQ